MPEPVVSRFVRASGTHWLPVILLAFGSPWPVVAQSTGATGDTAGRAESFVHESWTVEDGLPVNSVNALLQSRDGYLWIATFDGLVRFDGVRFTVFNAANWMCPTGSAT
jgi:hypothetical protein